MQHLLKSRDYDVVVLRQRSLRHLTNLVTTFISWDSIFIFSTFDAYKSTWYRILKYLERPRKNHKAEYLFEETIQYKVKYDRRDYLVKYDRRYYRL
jgi:hypothetical protein